MAIKCQITGKKTQSGNKVSHSQVKTKRGFKPNVQTKKMINPATGKIIKISLSTRALKTLAKWQAAGKTFDLKKLANK